MAKLHYNKIPSDDNSAALEAIAAYKAQNPVKYEQKKEALFARYGLDSVKDSVDPVEDESDVELKELKKAVAKKAPAPAQQAQPPQEAPVEATPQLQM